MPQPHPRHASHPHAPHPRAFRLLVGFGFLVSGAAGLIDQVVWSRYLTLFLGSTTRAYTIVLATFMGGLALGNHVFGRRADRARSALRLYAALELGIGLTCLFFPELYALAARAYIALAAGQDLAPGLRAALKLGLAVTTILLPTFLMGGTLPALARVIVRRMSQVAGSVGWLYFVNSAGAALGAILAGFFLIPTLGLEPTIRASGGVNLLLALLFITAARALARTQETADVTLNADSPPDDAAPSADSEIADAAPSADSEIADAAQEPWSFTTRQRNVALVVIGISGGVSMLYEVVWTRLLSLVLGSSTYSFTIMVATFITGITLGSLAVSRLYAPKASHPDPFKALAWAELGVFVSVMPLVPLYDHLPFYFASIASLVDRVPSHFGYYLAVKVAIAFALMFLPTFFIGMTLPLATRVAVDRLQVLGRRIGSVFSINTVGTVVGAVLTGLWLIPSLQLRGTLILGMSLSGLLATLLFSQASALPRRVRFGLPAGAGLVFVALLALFPTWNALILNFGVFRHKQFSMRTYDELVAELRPFEVVDAQDGADTSVAILKDTRTGNIYMKVNGKTDAGTGNDMTTQIWLGQLGMLLNPAAKDAMVIGLGSGVTAGSVLTHPDTSVDVVEISEAVANGARYFAPYNHDALKNPNLHLHLTDAKEFFKLRPNTRWDVVISEPSNPWISGIGNLFSVEYFTDIAQHLQPGGVLVQWIHLYELNDDLLRIILNTIGSVFPHVEVWQCNTADVLLVGSLRPITLDPAHVAERLALPAVHDDLNRPHMRRNMADPRLLALNQVLSAQTFAAQFPGEGELNRDTHPILEYRAPRAFFANQTATLLWTLDERRQSPRDSHLHVHELLTQHPLDGPALANVVTLLEERAGFPDAALLKALAWAFEFSDPKSPLARHLIATYLDPEDLSAIRGAAQGEALAAAVEAKIRAQATSLFFVPGLAKR